jgi:hypothetical protein
MWNSMNNLYENIGRSGPCIGPFIDHPVALSNRESKSSPWVCIGQRQLFEDLRIQEIYCERIAMTTAYL